MDVADGSQGDDEAFAWLEKAIEDRSWLITWLNVDPLFDPIRNDGRFRQPSRRVWRAGQDENDSGLRH